MEGYQVDSSYSYNFHAQSLSSSIGIVKEKTMNPRVLLIDDELALIRNLSELLRRRGFDASVAANGMDGIKRLEVEDFDVILLDLRMPGLSGIDVLKRIKAIDKNYPEVIILTGFSTIESSLDGLQYGAFDYMTKPIKIEDLAERIRKAYQKRAIRKGI